MFPILVLSILVVEPLFAQRPAPVLNEIETFSNYSEYLKTQTNGAVKAVHDSYLSFRVDNSTKVATPILPFSNPDLIHSLFETDVRQYIKNADAPDFVTAKKNYYATQTFDPKTQQYSRSYVYLSDWHSLNHNPIRKINLPTQVYGQHFEAIEDKEIEQSPLLESSLHKKLDELTGTEMTAGNKLKLLGNGAISFREKVRMVKESKKFFHSVVMVQYCDESSSEIVNAMIERAQAGVDVRLITESVWTKLILKKCLKKLRAGGVKVTLGKGFFNPHTMFTVHHTKFWIRDGEEAIIGGQNMHDFENTSNGFNNQTRDKDVHVTGPAVTDMMREYIRMWNHEYAKPDVTMDQFQKFVDDKIAEEKSLKLRGPELYEDWLHPEDVSQIPGVCRVLVQGSKTAANPNIISKAYIEILKNVKYNMIINTPTFRFEDGTLNAYDNSQIIKAIKDGSNRGVVVDLISNGVDGGWGEAGFQLRKMAIRLRKKGNIGLAFYLEALDRALAIKNGRAQRKSLMYALKDTKIDMWLYFNHIHSKQMSFDHIMTSTGSFNLDSHSYKNHESTMICLDKKLADESIIGFISDIVNSTPVIK